jgi:uncharacterized membrane protein YkgB
MNFKIMQLYREVDEKIVTWLSANSLWILRISIGIVYIWFGALKLIPAPVRPKG